MLPRELRKRSDARGETSRFDPLLLNEKSEASFLMFLLQLWMPLKLKTKLEKLSNASGKTSCFRLHVSEPESKSNPESFHSTLPPDLGAALSLQERL